MSDGELPRAYTGYIPGANGVHLFYRLEGHGTDTIVVLHGGPGLTSEGLRPDLKPLTKRHVLLYFDQRGSGRSEMPDTLQLTAALMVDDLEMLRRAFRLERLTLLGHSWGGGLAILYASRHPERVQRLILVGPIAPRKHPYSDQFIAAITARYDSAETIHDSIVTTAQEVAAEPHPACRERFRMFFRAVAATPDAGSRIKGNPCSTADNVRAMDVVLRRVGSSLNRNSDPNGEYDWRPLARAVSAPTLVVHGDRDPLPLAGS
ncbi:MAG TPA: alpha/beta hydrolase, partial [Gemmatimonadales bacterium]|nr:alpha/beta hydrolase [Gemmatimonadales bacterium]